MSPSLELQIDFLSKMKRVRIAFSFAFVNNNKLQSHIWLNQAAKNYH